MSAIEHFEPLARAVEEGRPLVLLLGQDAWSTPARPDAALVAALKRIDRFSQDAVASGFPALLRELLATDFYGWLAEFYDRQPAPEWIEPVTALSWNAVFTTSIDPMLARAFRTHGREVEAVLTKEDDPVAPRNRRQLHITYLFGRAGELPGDGGPPSSSQELRRRTALHAASLLARTVETTSPLGVLVIDGFTCGRDWLSTDALVGMLSAFQAQQVLWFGWDPEVQGSTDRQLVEELAEPGGPVVFIRDRLATALKALDLAHRIDLTTPVRVASEDAVSIGEAVLQLSAATRLKTSTGAAIVDDTWLSPLPPLGPDAEYTEFRRFHGHVEDARRLIEGLRRGFAIQRQFEALLTDRVLDALGNTARAKEPILIHGQSGSGKSLALARLAYDIRDAKQFPVLLASRATRVPAVDELDEFCLLAEDAGAAATLLICDANAPVARYRDLLRGFMSRGRRVVVVGSAYRLVDAPEAETHATSKDFLEIPTELSDQEIEGLQELLRRFVGAAPRVTGSQYLLPAIYRMLPDARPHLAAGLAKEARVAEEILRSRGRRVGSPSKAVGQLAQALMEAGLLNPQTLLEEQIDEFLGCMSDAATRAIDYVMVPGKLECPVPIDVLMRAIGGTENRTNIGTLFGRIDLFRWSTDDQDDVFIHPRLRIEAELICARRLGTSQAEAEVAIRLLNSASPSSYGSCERRFVLDLVHRLGPDGPYGFRYARQYLDIARALTEMRTRRGVIDPSLMLQEATLRRRLLRDAPTLAEVDPAVVLEEAREVVDRALDEFGGSRSPGLKRMCANLKVERAAIYGFRAVQRWRQGAPLDEVWQFYLAARDSSRAATYATDTYYATDVSLWVPADLLKEADWSDEQRAELVADIWDALERVESDQLDIDQREQYEMRRVKVGHTLDNKELQHDALAALQASGSRAGYFLNARAVGGPAFGHETPEDAHVDRASEAAAFLEEHWDQIRDDARCLRYMLRCRWLTSTRTYLFGCERDPLPTEDRHLRSLLDLVEQLRLVEGALGDARTRYLQAVLQWRLLREHDARDLWRELSRETEFSDPRRVVRHHVWTDAEGKPQIFHGRVTTDRADRGRFRVRVEEIRQEVELLQRDFRDLDLRRGGGVPGGFHIAFNYIGPVADRPRRRGGGA